MSRRLRVSSGIVAALMIAFPAPAGRAEDRVTIQRSGSSGTMTVTGEIEDYTAQRLTIRLQEGTARRSFPAAEVVGIETYRSESQERGQQELSANNFAAAEAFFAAALKEEVRRWVQQDLYADLVRCAACRGDRAAAGTWFVRMIEQQPESRYWGVTPLIWGAENVGDDLRNAAATWLNSPTDAARLIGASILLLDAAQGDAARKTLDALARMPDVNLQSLARAQLWRARLAAGDISATELQVWRQQVDAMPMAIRGGPLYVLARAAADRSDLEHAAADWLWLPLVYDEDLPLAARALVDAGSALARLGRRDDAATLFQEAIDRFGWSPFAREAQQRLDALTSTGTPNGG